MDKDIITLNEDLTAENTKLIVVIDNIQSKWWFKVFNWFGF